MGCADHVHARLKQEAAEEQARIASTAADAGEKNRRTLLSVLRNLLPAAPR